MFEAALQNETKAHVTRSTNRVITWHYRRAVKQDGVKPPLGARPSLACGAGGPSELRRRRVELAGPAAVAADFPNLVGSLVAGLSRRLPEQSELRRFRSCRRSRKRGFMRPESERDPLSRFLAF
jgi:hypothetical protein